MVRQLRGHLGIAFLQQLLEIVEGLGVLQVQPEIQKPSCTCSPTAAKSSSQLHDVQGLQPSKILMHCRQNPRRLSK